MLTSDIRSQIDAIWNAFWSGGISNPMEVLEQITYLLFIRRLDDAHTLEESKALLLKQPMAQRIFPEGKDALGRPYDDLFDLADDTHQSCVEVVLQALKAADYHNDFQHLEAMIRSKGNLVPEMYRLCPDFVVAFER